MSHHEVLVQHMVDLHKATAEFRCKSSSKRFATRSTVQRRLSIDNWNPGPRRVKGNAFEQQIAGKSHVITLQEASEYVGH